MNTSVVKVPEPFMKDGDDGGGDGDGDGDGDDGVGDGDDDDGGGDGDGARALLVSQTSPSHTNSAMMVTIFTTFSRLSTHLIGFL